MTKAPAHLGLPRSRPQLRNQGFTLVELMVSITVLAMLGGLVMQLMGSASKLTSTSKLASDCDTEARYALNQIAADLAHRVRRPDVDAFVEKATGNDRLYFFSETPGYHPELKATERSNVSLVGYRVKTSKNSFGKTVSKLERYAKALPWTTVASGSGIENPMPFVILDSSGKPVPSSTLAGGGLGAGGSFPKVMMKDPTEELYYQPIAENVLRFEVSLLRAPDSSNPASLIAARLLTDLEIPPELSRYGFNNVSAVVATLAVLDSQNAIKVAEADLTNLTFDDTIPNDFPKYPLEAWSATFMSNVKTWSKPMTNGLRFYQRVIGL